MWLLFNLISISLPMMPYFTFVKRWIVDFEIKFGICYLMVTVWMKWRMKARLQAWMKGKYSINTGRFPKMWVGSLINCCRPNCEVTTSILGPSYVVLSCLYQVDDLVLKSPRNEFDCKFHFMRVLNYLQIFQRNLWTDLVIDIKK